MEKKSHKCIRKGTHYTLYMQMVTGRTTQHRANCVINVPIERLKNRFHALATRNRFFFFSFLASHTMTTARRTVHIDDPSIHHLHMLPIKYRSLALKGFCILCCFRLQLTDHCYVGRNGPRKTTACTTKRRSWDACAIHSAQPIYNDVPLLKVRGTYKCNMFFNPLKKIAAQCKCDSIRVHNGDWWPSCSRFLTATKLVVSFLNLSQVLL